MTSNSEASTTTNGDRGTGDCPCINSTVIVAPFSDCFLEENDRIVGATNSSRTPGIRSRDVCLPLEFGANVCAPHDVGLDPRCTGNNRQSSSGGNSSSSDAPAFCGEYWCYVDFDKCKRSSELLYRSQMYAATNPSLELYYSYSVCNASADNFLSYQTTENVNGVTLKATIPVMKELVHYKFATNTSHGLVVADSHGPEYYNDSIPWMGHVIDYFNAVIELSNLKGVEYTFRSLGADAAGFDPFTGVVHDVQSGLTDVALSSYWFTSDRMQMTPYTTPVAVDQILLWIPQPTLSGGSLEANIIKVFAPFTPSLWFVLCILIVVTALLNVWLATTHGVHSYLSVRLRPARLPDATLATKARIIGGLCLDSIIMFFNYMFGQTAELDWQSTRAQKVLMFGFAFLILIGVTSYTANLAAFLTVAGVATYIGSMEDAIYTNTPVCIHPVMRKELENVWPKATFVVNTENSESDGMVDSYEQGKCQAIASSMMEIRISAELMKRFCDNELVSTGSLVLENPIAFPVAERYASGLSYWLFKAETLGVTYDSFAEAAYPPLACSLKLALSDTNNGDASGPPSLSPANFALPILLCIVCVIVAMLTHLFGNRCSTAGMEISQSTAAGRLNARRPSLAVEENTQMNNNTMPVAMTHPDKVSAWTMQSVLLQQAAMGASYTDRGLLDTWAAAADHQQTQETMEELLTIQKKMMEMFADILAQQQLSQSTTKVTFTEHNDTDNQENGSSSDHAKEE